MKRFALAVLLVFAITALVVMPAFAADTCDQDPTMTAMHQPTVESLTLHVQHAIEMGHIGANLGTALLAPLNTAATTTLPLASRVSALQKFVYLVNAQAGKGIDADCAKSLVTQAQQTIPTLGK